MTTPIFVSSRDGQQFVRTAVSSVIAALFAATLAFAPDVSAQTNKPVVKKQTVSKATPVRTQKVTAVRKRASLQKVTTVQEDVRVQEAAPAQATVAPQAAAQLVLQKAAPAQTEVAAREPVAAAPIVTEQASTEAVAVNVATAQPIQTEPAKSDQPETDPAQFALVPVAPGGVKQGAGGDPAVKPEGDDDCTVCHKRRQTLMLPCQSLSYRRHVDHGDTLGACPPTVGSRAE